MAGAASGIAATKGRLRALAPQEGVAHRVWVALSAAFAAVSGLLPHVLHHAGPLAGAALFAGATGSLLFGVLGFLAAIPFLLRLHRRFGGWDAPALALSAFAVAFSLSSFVIGPRIAGGDAGGSSTEAAPTPAPKPASGAAPGSAVGTDPNAAGTGEEGGGHAGHH